MQDSFFHDKREKISAAIYIVTNLLSDNEPLKWKLRDISLCLLPVVYVKDNKQSSFYETLIHELISKCFEIISVMEVARYAGIISKMNHSIITAEIHILIEYLEKEIKTFPMIKDIMLGEKQLDYKLSIGNMIKNKKEYVKKDTNSRQSIIINMLQNKNNLTIKDFTKSIQDCSEKTIQRELSTLVIKGILKKEGERRWSTYSRN